MRTGTLVKAHRTLVAAVLTLAACGHPASPDAGDDTGALIPQDASDDLARDAAPDDTQDDAVAVADAPDDAASDAADAGAPRIRYVIVVVKENHTFDNLFTEFPGADVALTAPLSDGTIITRPRAPSGGLPREVSHGYTAAMTAYADGGMNGFDRVSGARPDSGADDHLPFVYYGESQLPNYYAYARNFVLCDHFFSTVAGPTFPGHLATIAAQSPAYGNPFCSDPSCPADAVLHWSCSDPAPTRVQTYDPVTCATGTAFPCFDVPTVVDTLPAGMSWRAYGPVADGVVLTPFAAVRSTGADPAVRAAHFRDQTTVAADIARGDLANLTYVSASAGEASEHPPSDPCAGENYTVAVVNALMASPHWNESVVVITWDDWGGFYDHVPPLANRCPSGQFFNTGFRVPALIISPYARRGYIKHGGAEHASIPRLIEDLFGTPRLVARDPHARDMRAGTLLDAFDFASPPRPPMMLTPRVCP